MPDKCVPMRRCGAQYPGWLDGTHPNVPEDVVTLEVCYSNSRFGRLDCCRRRTEIKVKKCIGGYYVYRLSKRHKCDDRYCGDAGAGKFY